MLLLILSIYNKNDWSRLRLLSPPILWLVAEMREVTITKYDVLVTGIACTKHSRLPQHPMLARVQNAPKRPRYSEIRALLQRDNNCTGVSAILRARSRTHPPSLHARGHAGTRVSAAREVHRAWVHVEAGASVDRHPSRPTVRRRSFVSRQQESPSSVEVLLSSPVTAREVTIFRRFWTSFCQSASRCVRSASERGAWPRVEGALHPSLSIFLSLSKCELSCTTAEFEKPRRRTLNSKAELEAASKSRFQYREYII